MVIPIHACEPLIPTAPGDLPDRIFVGNDAPLLEDSAYVLVVLNRALRGVDNPVIDGAIAHANSLNLGIVVYSELLEAADYASDRLFYFALGAFRALARSLTKQSIPCIQTIKKADDTQDVLSLLASQAAAIYTDEDYTVWDKAKLKRLLSIASQSVFFIDAARLVPTRVLPSGLKTTPAFRKAHSERRDHYSQLRASVANSDIFSNRCRLDLELSYSHNFANYDDAELTACVAQCDINHTIKISAEHPPTQAEISRRIATLKAEILSRYKWIRNNPALAHSTSQLSPYLHFGMVSPHQILAEIGASEVPKTYTWKFRDEFLTWREWSHYQAFHKPELHSYQALPTKAKQTLDDHANDPRLELTPLEDILQGRTPDKTWNAAQKEWLTTGWLHNNLRMYWAKQLLRFTKSPKAAWDTACYINDSISLDGRDPATYASMQWAFGNAKPGYSEKEIYGWVAPKSDRAILKRKGMAKWIDERT
ncbi:MAG: hypothetical protein AAFV90_07455 [Cyanobacteria bacterium J06634_5]